MPPPGQPQPLLAVPNVSEGRDRMAVEAIADAFSAPGVRLLDVHSDADHHRSVFTLAGAPGALAHALLRGAREAIARIDLNAARGIHPHVGAIDVVPLVYLDAGSEGAACAEALLTADMLGEELALPVFLYGALAAGRTRASLRRGGIDELTRRLTAGELEPDFGPATPHPTAGATLLAARPPLVAFNVTLAPPADLATAQDIAFRIREGGPEGLRGVRALGLTLASQGGIPQVSMNIEDPTEVPPARTLEAIAKHAQISGAELVGLAPRAALAGLPAELNIKGNTLEQALEQ